MFDLQAGVHFEEEELLPFGVEEKFHRPCRAIFCRLSEVDRRQDEVAAQRIRQAGCRSFLDDLLIAALERTVAFAQRHDVAFAITENLDLDMPGPRDIAFEEHARIAKTALALAYHAGKAVTELGLVRADAHADAAAACGRLENDRIADVGSRAGGLVFPGQQAGAGRQRHALFLGQSAGAVLETEGADMLGSRADEDDPCGLAGFGKFGILGEEPVARVDIARARLLRRGDDRRAIEVAFGCGGRPDAYRTVGQRHMQRIGIGFRIDRDRTQTHGP